MKDVRFFIIGLMMLSISARDRYAVDFDVSMEFEQADPIRKQAYQIKKELPIMEFCRSLYEKNNLMLLHPMQVPLIPKIVHMIWVGPKNLPDVYFRCRESVRKYLRDWEFRLWTDEDIEGFNLVNKAAYDEEKNYGGKSDILRYEILDRYGGVYLDIDVELIQSLDILHSTYEFYCCMMPCDRIASINNCVIGASAGHPIIKGCIAEVGRRRGTLDVLTRTGPLLFQEVFHALAPSLIDRRIIALPKSFFFPLARKMPETREELHVLLKPETFGMHHWAGTWIDPENRAYMRKQWREVNSLLVNDGIVDKLRTAFAWVKDKIRAAF